MEKFEYKLDMDSIEKISSGLVNYFEKNDYDPFSAFVACIMYEECVIEMMKVNRNDIKELRNDMMKRLDGEF